MSLTCGCKKILSLAEAYGKKSWPTSILSSWCYGLSHSFQFILNKKNSLQILVILCFRIEYCLGYAHWLMTKTHLSVITSDFKAPRWQQHKHSPNPVLSLTFLWLLNMWTSTELCYVKKIFCSNVANVLRPVRGLQHSQKYSIKENKMSVFYKTILLQHKG